MIQQRQILKLCSCVWVENTKSTPKRGLIVKCTWRPRSAEMTSCSELGRRTSGALTCAPAPPRNLRQWKLCLPGLAFDRPPNLCPRQSQPRASHVSSWGISVTWRWPVCCRTFIAGVYPLDDIALSAPGLWQSKMSAGTASAPSFGAEDHRFILTPHLLCTWSPSYDQPTSLMWGKFISRSYRSTNMLRFCFKNHSFERFPPKHILKSNEKVFIHTHLSQSIELVIFLLSPSSSSDFHVLLSTSFWGQRQPWEAYL